MSTLSKTVNGDFKYFVKVQKAYQEGVNNEWFVEGIASGTLEDRDSERMAKSVLEKFVEGLPLPLTNAHPRPGEVGGQFGEVVEARVMDDANNSLFIKAKLDQDHPFVPYMMKQVQKGKKHAFSVEGYVKKASTVWSDRLKKFITEFEDVKPKTISITTEPSYIGSFMDVVSKSYKDVVDPETISDNTVSNSNNDVDMPEDKKVTETEQVQETVTETATVEIPVEEVKAPAVEEVKAEETVSEVPEVVVEETKEEVEVEAPVAETKVEAPVEETKKSYETDMAKEEVMKAVDGAFDHAALCSKVDELCVAVQSIEMILQRLVESDQETMKSVKEFENVTKSIHTDMEAIKGLPLMKKSQVVAKEFPEEKAPEATKPFGYSAVTSVLQQN